MKAGWCAAALLLFAVASGTAQDRPGRRGQDKAPKVGDPAPDFKLKRLGDPDQEVKLSEFSGKSPVVLIFGSYT